MKSFATETDILVQNVETAEIPEVKLLDKVVGRPAVVQRQALMVQTVPVPVLTVLENRGGSAIAVHWRVGGRVRGERHRSVVLYS